MGRLQQTGASLLAALWLTSCSHIPDGMMPGGHETGHEEDTTIVLITPQNPPGVGGSLVPRAAPDTLYDLGLLAQRQDPATSNPARPGAACDDGLPNDLVTREIYRRLSAGDRFEDAANDDVKDKGVPSLKEPSIQERIAAYRSERLEFYEDLFACRKGNETIHQLARNLASNPNNSRAFMELFVELVEQRGDHVLDHYTTEDFNKYAEMILDFGLYNLRTRFADLDQFVDRDKVLQKLEKRVEAEHESLSLHALKSELVLIFQAQNGLPAQVRTDLQTSLEKIVSQELVTHIGEQLSNRLKQQQTGQKFEI